VSILEWTPSRIYEEILKAREVLRNVVHKTPLDLSNTFSRLTGAEVYLKLENLQKTGAFKVRGAFYKIWMIPKNEREKGVVTASAGNHAQGVAYASSKLNIKATIVMPETAPLAKVEAVKGYGAEVILHGKIYDEANELALKIAKERGATYVHPFDDPYVIAGQGTIGAEIEEQLGGPPDVVVIQIGGGGLASGVASWFKVRYGNRVKIIGVEPTYAPKFTESLKAGKPIEVSAVPGLMDGLITKRPGDLTFSLLSQLLDDIVLVNDKEVARAIYLLLERAKTLSEGAGAAGLAALLEGKVKNVEGKKVVTIISGGNIDMTRLSKIVEYQLAREERVVRLQGLVPDSPGWLNRVLGILARARFNIIDIKHDRMIPFVDPGWALVEVLAEAPSKDMVKKVVEELNGMGLPFKEVSI
jgi:threonine dehydratase